MSCAFRVQFVVLRTLFAGGKRRKPHFTQCARSCTVLCWVQTPSRGHATREKKRDFSNQRSRMCKRLSSILILYSYHLTSFCVLDAGLCFCGMNKLSFSVGGSFGQDVKYNQEGVSAVVKVQPNRPNLKWDSLPTQSKRTQTIQIVVRRVWRAWTWQLRITLFLWVTETAYH